MVWPQLLRHSLASRLVRGVFLVPEGGGGQIKGHGHVIGLGHVLELLEDIEKADQGVGVLAVLGGQQLDAVERPVDNAVAVDDQQAHAKRLLQGNFRYPD